MTRMSLQQAAHLLNGELLGNNSEFGAVSIDSRSLSSGELFIALRGPRFDAHDFLTAVQARGASGALLERPQLLDLPQIRVEDARLALGQLGALWRDRFKNPVIALTGSNGKTTVKEMLAAILRVRNPVLATQGNLNNDIGVPLMLLRLREDYAYAVIEMGANHGGEIAYLTRLTRPDVAIINNAAPCHLEGFNDLDGVARGKGEIFQGLAPGGVAIINRDDPYADYWSELAKGHQIIDFALDRQARVRGRVQDAALNRFRLSAGGETIDIELPLLGRHNVRNALAAAAAGLALGVTLDDIGRGLQTVQGVAGRLQRFPGPYGSIVIHDAYNANPSSLEAALSAMSEIAGEKWLILGDMAELGATAEHWHRQAGHYAREQGIHRLFALGTLSQQGVMAFGPGGWHFETMEALLQALQTALAQTGAEPVILVKGSRSMRMERVVDALITKSYPPVEKGVLS